MRIAVLEARVDASFAPLWLMARKQPGKNCRRAADLPLRRDHGATGTCAIYVVMSVSYANGKAWHDARIGKLRTAVMGVAGVRQFKTSRGAEDVRRHFGTNVWDGLRRVTGAGAVRIAGRRDLADQGPRQHRRRAAEPVDRLRPRGRP